MGGMLDKLVRNGNEVLVAYMTNGSVAVFDADVRRYLQFMELVLPVFAQGDKAEESIRAKAGDIRSFLASKHPGQVDLEPVQRMKAFIRYAEAVAGIEVMGLDASHARFLDLPFYKTGRVKKDPIGPDDIAIVRDLMTEFRPTKIFVAGDLSDPHGTHRMCYSAISGALEEYREAEGDEKAPDVWLYRGAWQEWEIDRADVFLPLSKADLDRKIEAIFKHESQKDRAMFPGAYDTREFWERARDRNTRTAELLNNLGLPEFHAAEAYVVVRQMP
jgi:glucosamine-6-phosphate deaminase